MATRTRGAGRRGALLAAALVLAGMTVVPAAPAIAGPGPWHRSMLVYHQDGRTADGWKRHLMRVAPDGAFTGQWLFDAAVLTAERFNGKDLMYGGLTGADLTGLLDRTFADAARLDRAADELAARFGAPPKQIPVSITVPWFANSGTLQLPGSTTTLDLSRPADRVAAADWYLGQIADRTAKAGWKRLCLYGSYWHREDVADAWGDPDFVTRVNGRAHARNMSTVWVPYYGAPNAWNGSALGFDVVNVQPSYSFPSRPRAVPGTAGAWSAGTPMTVCSASPSTWGSRTGSVRSSWSRTTTRRPA